MTDKSKLAAKTGSSLPVERCQVCDHPDLKSVLFLGYLPPVNQMHTIGERPHEQPAYPAELLYCPKCDLVQLGLIVDPGILFAPAYPYTSGTTKILHENFGELQRESEELLSLGAGDLVVDIGSNDGTLLSKFKAAGYQVLGIEPTNTGHLAAEKGIPTEIAFFTREVAARINVRTGPAKLITAANVFAHIEDIHEIVEGIVDLLADDGVFISESHYLISLLETVQYDAIYHEHLRYYSLKSLRRLLEMHGLEVVHAKRIPTHGGSIRVYAARKGRRPVRSSVDEILAVEDARGAIPTQLEAFKRRAVMSKLLLHAMLRDIKEEGHRVYGISAPSRASTLVNYVGLDDGLIDCVLEIKGSKKIGKYLPGTLIPVIEESKLFEDQPEYALLLSWHIAEDLVPKLRELGFAGKFIVPLPEPRVL